MRFLEDLFSEGMKKKHKNGEEIWYRMKERNYIEIHARNLTDVAHKKERKS